MALGRDKTRIPATSGYIMMAATGQTKVDVGHLVEDTLKISADPILASDEFGNEMPIAYKIGIEFEMLQGDYTSWVDLDALINGNVDISIIEKSGGQETRDIVDVPFHYKIDSIYSNSKARTVKITVSTKAKKITDAIVDLTPPQ